MHRNNNLLTSKMYRYFAQVLDALIYLYPKYVQFNCESCTQTPELQSNPKYSAFKNAVGAVDGVLVEAQVPAVKQPTWQCRKGYVAQNVLAAVNFRFEFIFVLAGWEGSAHDTRVYNNAYAKGLKLPDMNYLLADAGYALRHGLMTPYRGVRYHLKEQAIASQRPSNAKELYNLRHAHLCNIIKRIFGCMKKKYRILASTPEVELPKQVLLVYGLCMMWNYIRKHEGHNPMLDEPNVECHDGPSGPTNPSMPSISLRAGQEDTIMKHRRDRLAAKMWKQYSSYTLARSQHVN